MRAKMEAMQEAIEAFVESLNHELANGRGRRGLKTEKLSDSCDSVQRAHRSAG